VKENNSIYGTFKKSPDPPEKQENQQENQRAPLKGKKLLKKVFAGKRNQLPGVPKSLED
jgi:hypothetical protein